MPRKRTKTQPESVEALEVLPLEREVVTSSEDDPIRRRSATDVLESLRHRPTRPKGRHGEAATSFASDDIRISVDGAMWQVEARRELTGEEKDRLAASGFHAVDDEERFWNASQRDLARNGTDINVVAVSLGKPNVYSGRGR